MSSNDEDMIQTREERGEADAEVMLGLSSQLYEARAELAELARQSDAMHEAFHLVHDQVHVAGPLLQRITNLVLAMPTRDADLTVWLDDVRASGVLEFDDEPARGISHAERLVRDVLDNPTGE
jgi:hypothetical protein